MKTSNELHDLWVAQGDKVENLNEKLNVAMLDDSVTAEELQKIKNERDTAKMKRDMFKEQYTEARANEVVNMSEEDKKPLTENEEEVKANFVKDFKNLVRGRFQNLLDSKTDNSGSDAGLTIPQDIRTAINTLVRQYDSLQEYVNVENVTTLTGSRVYEKWTDITGLANIDDEAGKIADIDDPNFLLSNTLSSAMLVSQQLLTACLLTLLKISLHGCLVGLLKKLWLLVTRQSWVLLTNSQLNQH